MPVIPDQQLLIERIVKLQRNLAKKQEKIEFLQEHVKQLTETLQKKSKIIISYAMNQDVEALSTELSEQNKVCSFSKTNDLVDGRDIEKNICLELRTFGGLVSSSLWFFWEVYLVWFFNPFCPCFLLQNLCNNCTERFICFSLWA